VKQPIDGKDSLRSDIIKTMYPLVESMAALGLIIIVSRFIKRRSKGLQRLFIPSSLVAGLIGLLAGPQILGVFSADLTGYWSALPRYLISVVFAGLFLGAAIPSGREIWRLAGPQIAFGSTLAWGQYVIGLLLTMTLLTPFFDAHPAAGALIEISFEGGHGTAAGLAPTFSRIGWEQGTDVALALATLSMLCAIFAGILLVNWRRRRQGKLLSGDPGQAYERLLAESGYDLRVMGRQLVSAPQTVLLNLTALAASIGFGAMLLSGLIQLEKLTIAHLTSLRFFAYMPLFPMAMIGGLAVQVGFKRLNKDHLISKRTAGNITALALDVLIAAAVATISLQAIGQNLAIFAILGLAGIAWIIAAFLLIAPRVFPEHWFEKGLADMGQSMGTTATGLLLMRLADPGNKARSREGFSYKQLGFEPFLGGGLITATAVVLIHELGSGTMLLLALVMTLFWLVLGLSMATKRRRGSDPPAPGALRQIETRPRGVA
jgi:glutamate:Na+ symporter, ESS family